MLIVDTGVLVAATDRDERDHSPAVEGIQYAGLRLGGTDVSLVQHPSATVSP